MKILVTSDGSKASLAAVQHAAELAIALRTKDRITLLSVHDHLAFQHVKKFVNQGALEDYLRELSEKELAAARAVLEKSRVKFDIEIRQGHVADEIVKSAHEGKFDMIVMGTKGRSALKDLLLGSVAQRVVAMSKIPVVLVK
jgi:nucleotide-binding universal stress UspA family protein